MKRDGPWLRGREESRARVRVRVWFEEREEKSEKGLKRDLEEGKERAKG